MYFLNIEFNLFMIADKKNMGYNDIQDYKYSD